MPRSRDRAQPPAPAAQPPAPDDSAPQAAVVEAPTEAPPAKKKAKAANAKAPAVVRYKDDKGNTWVGRGKRPQWLRDALAAGRKIEEFAAK